MVILQNVSVSVRPHNIVQVIISKTNLHGIAFLIALIAKWLGMTAVSLSQNTTEMIVIMMD